MTSKKVNFFAGLILIAGMLVLSSGCATLLYPFFPKSSETTTTTSSGSGTTYPPGYFTVSGAVSSGALTPTMEGGVAIFESKAEMQSGAPPLTSESYAFTAGSFSYSLSTNEAGTYYIVAYYPGQGGGGEPSWVGGPGITSDMTMTQFLAALTGVDLSSSSPTATVNITLYQFTGP